MPTGTGRSSSLPVDVRSLAASFEDGDYRFIDGKLDSLVCLAARSEKGFTCAVDTLTFLLDRRYDSGRNKPAWIKSMVSDRLTGLFRSVIRITDTQCGRLVRVGHDERRALCPPPGHGSRLFIDAAGFPPEGRDSLARLVVACYEIGWRDMVVFGLEGQRFLGCGLGGDSGQTRIEVYGSSGDYLGSGLDGATMIVHGTAQDQVGQILKRGKLVIYGDVGQTLLYGAKGGEIFVMGSAAGRPLINAVGSPRAIINGTCLDYLAESFMAGDSLNGGGFAIVNGVSLDHRGTVREMDTPYPGGNLFSLASGGAIYIRDPHGKVEENQLNGGSFFALRKVDWKLILPYLEENERLFGIPINELLSVDGKRREPADVYRKVSVSEQKNTVLI